MSNVRCWFYQHGRCRHDNCYFKHDHQVKARSPDCAFFLKGHCRYGDKCVWFHDDGKGADQDVRGDQVPEPKTPSGDADIPRNPNEETKDAWSDDESTEEPVAEDWRNVKRKKGSPSSANATVGKSPLKGDETGDTCVNPFSILDELD